MENIKLTITVQKPSGYTSTKTVLVSEEVFNQVEELTTSNTDLLEKAKREAEDKFSDSLFSKADNEAVRGVFIQGAQFIINQLKNGEWKL